MGQRWVAATSKEAVVTVQETSFEAFGGFVELQARCKTYNKQQ